MMEEPLYNNWKDIKNSNKQSMTFRSKFSKAIETLKIVHLNLRQAMQFLIIPQLESLTWVPILTLGESIIAMLMGHLRANHLITQATAFFQSRPPQPKRRDSLISSSGSRKSSTCQSSNQKTKMKRTPQTPKLVKNNWEKCLSTITTLFANYSPSKNK